VLLVDDQPIVAESVRRMLADEADVEFHYCPDPGKVLETANALQPTVILQDLVMPDVDGLMLVRFYRANPGTRQTPLVVLSSKEEPVIKARAFALGANDYLVKLPDKLELVARLRYHSRSYRNQVERDEAYRQLEESRRQLAEEVAQAAHYVESLLPARLDGPVSADWRFVPSTQLGGDMFGYHWLDEDHLSLYLLDVSGHGVGSSLLAVSVANLLGARSLPDVDLREPGQVLARLSDAFPMERQQGKYFTMWYGVYRRREHALAWANAGHPDALLFTGPAPATAAVHRLAASGPGIGIFAGFPYDTEVNPLGDYARLLVYSDGVFEIARPDGSMWKHSEFVEHVAGLLPADGPLMDPLLAAVRDMHGEALLADDFSVLDVRFARA
jgi:sigma-B regulation protein RsbU (phosphoserine phosphatase)